MESHQPVMKSSKLQFTFVSMKIGHFFQGQSAGFALETTAKIYVVLVNFALLMAVLYIIACKFKLDL